MDENPRISCDQSKLASIIAFVTALVGKLDLQEIASLVRAVGTLFETESLDSLAQAAVTAPNDRVKQVIRFIRDRFGLVDADDLREAFRSLDSALWRKNNGQIDAIEAARSKRIQEIDGIENDEVHNWWQSFFSILCVHGPAHEWSTIAWHLGQIGIDDPEHQIAEWLADQSPSPEDFYLAEHGPAMLALAKKLIRSCAQLASLPEREVRARLWKAMRRTNDGKNPLFERDYWLRWGPWAKANLFGGELAA